MLFVIALLKNTNIRKHSIEATTMKDVLAILLIEYGSEFLGNVILTHSNVAANVAMMPPNARLASLAAPIDPMIVIINSASQKIVSTMFKIIFAFVLPHFFNRSTWVVSN